MFDRKRVQTGNVNKLVLIYPLRTLLVVARIIVNICFGSVGGLLILKEKANSKNKMASKWDMKRRDRLNPASIYDHLVGYFWLFWLPWNVSIFSLIFY